EGVYGDERVAHGLRMRSLRFEAIPGFPTHGTLVGPSHCAPDEMRPGILCIHGTDETLAHRNVLSPVDKPNRAYAIELAQRGAVTLAVDQFGFGEGNAGRSQAEVVDSFYRKYPEGSLDGARLSVHQCAVDFLASHPLVDASRLGCMGHSLGGRAAVYLAALDPRIRACVSSAGISPNLTNGFRNRPRKDSFSPRLDDEMERTGKSAFEYQELLALIAPRAALLLEPWNDPYNPMIEPVFRCFEKARFVFQLCGVPENLQILCHGEGHDTLPDIRNYAYAWLLKKLGVVE
ncbi:MAG: acyl-CoA thioester hydrolase/BAAT C-terminal domain-containing protein, partial [Kiritimatiellia bacterium]|nr:acyl-CoA thioester hydrolase/BAAT C-terminal domain-containing protein [Kiritimatiellia bacterium]